VPQRSPIDHNCVSVPAAIADVTFSVLWIRTKLPSRATNFKLRHYRSPTRRQAPGGRRRYCANSLSNAIFAGGEDGVPCDLGPDIQWVESYVAADKTFCVYLAKDEEIIKKHAEISGFPATKITEVRKMIDPTTEHST
jgi:hypothetical protein